MNGFAARALLHAAGIVTAFLLAGSAALLLTAAGPTGAQPLLVAMLTGAAAALAHSSGQPLNTALLMSLSVLPFAAWLGVVGWREGIAVTAWPAAGGLLAAAAAGAVIGHRFRHSRRWRPGHSATALLTMALLLLLLLAPLLLTMPR